ncbi:hypothetical protein BofuT4_uP061880.1 [Botrytis cinerea T4]|uniref:Uncharacterized protein n=1 Tax=Botryotinia fuckeliana (strain T4) TaxID=999810 RepID=G2XU08_BOTF4|nr:hypothetical protein BofuT4_uP061880.1 [Botrytis cinerea T4]
MVYSIPAPEGKFNEPSMFPHLILSRHPLSLLVMPSYEVRMLFTLPSKSNPTYGYGSAF